VTVHIYVEGASDVAALRALLAAEGRASFASGVGLRLARLNNKDQLLRKIAPHAFQRLSQDPTSHVVAMPDLHPTVPFEGTPNAHRSCDELVELLQRRLRDEAQAKGWRSDRLDGLLRRFHAFPFSHDLEVLLLAAHEKLRAYLRARASLAGAFRHPAEEHDDRDPPKRVVQELFLRHRKVRYEPVIHAPAVLRNVPPSELRVSGECPRFAEFLDTLVRITGVPLP
jgi:hypothetical protein